MLYYCEKCGRVVENSNNDPNYKCDYCKSQVYPVPEKYWLDGLDFLITNESQKLLHEELVKTSSVFDQYLFDNRNKELSKRTAGLNAKLEIGKAIGDGKKVSREELLSGRLNDSNRTVVTCPYCHSTNTTKITTTAKVVNTALWGILGTKRHKNYHCNNCNSDF